MFKRKATKLGPLPKHPNLSEICEDLETFKVDKLVTEPIRTINANADITEWWKVFETFAEDMGNLELIQTKLNDYLLKLEETKLELDTTAKNIQNTIDENLEKTRKEFICDNNENEKNSNEN